MDPLHHGGTAGRDADAMVPFPQLTLGSSHASLHSPAEDRKPEGSRISDQTSSDKLSDLPTGLPWVSAESNTIRPHRSPVLASHALPSRLYGRSVDGGSLPSFSTADLESQRQANTSKGPYHTTGGSLSHHSASAEASQADAKPRVSFESEPGPSSSRPQVANIPMTSISNPPSPIHKGTPNSRSPSPLARATSPLRIFQHLTSNLTRHRHTQDERFVPVDPYKFKRKLKASLLSSPAANFIHLHEHHGSRDSVTCAECIPSSTMVTTGENIRWFITDNLPRQLYLNCLLRLPSMYFTRVAKLFEDAEVSKPDIQRMIECGGGGRGPAAQYWANRPNPANAGAAGMPGTDSSAHRPGFASPPRAFSPPPNAGVSGSGRASAAGTNQQPPLPFPDEWSSPIVPHSLIRFKQSWEAFIDSLLREWKTLNLVSALLLSAIMTMFQISSAESDPLTRSSASISLICALMSLSYGCVYIVRFGTMRSMYRASRWAEDARRTDTMIWWNVWVLLALPAVWLTWSMVAFIIAILSYVWRTGASDDPDPNAPPTLPPRTALGIRIAITCILALGLLYFALIVKTLRRYSVDLVNEGPRTLHGPGGTSPPHTPRSRAKEVDPAMEQRGRGRERRGGRGPTPDLGPAVEVVNVEVTDDGKDMGMVDNFKNNMLGLSRLGSRENAQVDLEKGSSGRGFSFLTGRYHRGPNHLWPWWACSNLLYLR